VNIIGCQNVEVPQVEIKHYSTNQLNKTKYLKRGDVDDYKDGVKNKSGMRDERNQSFEEVLKLK